MRGFMLSEDEVHVIQSIWADTYALRSSMDFIAWLSSQYPCTIRVEGYGTDLTEQARRDGVSTPRTGWQVPEVVVANLPELAF